MGRTLTVALLLILAVLSSVDSMAQDIDFDSRFETYADARSHLRELFRDQKFDEAIELLEWSRERFPDHLYANSFNLALIHFAAEAPERGVAAMEYALDRGIFFGKWDFEIPALAAYQELESFQQVKARSLSMLSEAEEKTSMKIEVVTPEGYSPEGEVWPLFIALHGGGENLEQFKPKWTSPVLREEFIVAYVQSSQVASMTGFHWQDEEKTARELREAFEQVRSAYNVNPDAVIVGGFSSGGFASLVVTFGESLPAIGFVALCPPVPESITDEMIQRAVSRGLRGTVLSTEFDRRLDAQKSFVEQVDAAGLEVNLVVSPDAGHWYPDDLDTRIDEAVTRIMIRGSDLEN